MHCVDGSAAPAISGKATKQTEPPSIPVKHFFPNGIFPEGEIQEYKDEYASIIYTFSCTKLAI
jgi:hypothetical protein